ncbi:GlxA family transcriptional regulator [Gryllotalpicola protaetiae]|uniref:Helix-turn-helix domain-containing protein n=1 Tax=Gryllotalpicola protaetiae TaxID=2419771 RepID=A0A387BRB2_9MICO|nr:DJ-1/PfpI family protein [Gryllotalpicola protaetiae]AYG04624.1 helix-turn-helix domain-containing protein [Gryllotalpicola protaetiae]
MQQDLANPRRVVVLALQPVVMFDLSIPLLIFGRDGYEVRVATENTGVIATTNGVSIQVECGLDALETADTVLVPGFGRATELSTAELSALRSARDRGTRMVSICTGAFALAAAGILDGVEATTHWAHAAELARRYPNVYVNPDALYVDHGDVITSAGVTAGIDLCLHLVESDLGAGASLDAARAIVAPLRREGGQAQYRPSPVVPDSDQLHSVLNWATGHLDHDLTSAVLSRRAHLSTRTFHRRCVELTGLPPGEWVTRQRLAYARRLLEDPTLSIDEVAIRSGIGSANNLRHHFRRALATTPSRYRNAFFREPENVPA